MDSKITKLDDFNEGFTAAPRKPHRSPQPTAKSARYSKGHVTTLATMQHKLQTQDTVMLSEFEKPQAAKSAVLKLRFRGMRIKAIKDGRKAIGYELIKQ